MPQKHRNTENFLGEQLVPIRHYLAEVSSKKKQFLYFCVSVANEKKRQLNESSPRRTERSVQGFQQRSFEIAGLGNTQDLRVIQSLPSYLSQRDSTFTIRRGLLEHLQEERFR
jgi:hypothetical protein